MKEMVGGCCVCSDERGWPDNPLVYCDGNGCTVAVHQACYGIVTVPTGPWYCRKCESGETKTKVVSVRCELCPSKSGALKRSDTGGWAHVVCALYIPEVRFGNVTSMEPIVLRLIPPERYNKTCYICADQGKTHRANAGACMQCNKSGCKQQFHVTCAQGLGLLCEEAGNYLDNVKYCGYCQHHYSKLAKTDNTEGVVVPTSHFSSVSPAPPPPPPPPAHSPASQPSPRHLPSPMPGPSGLNQVSNIRSPSHLQVSGQSEIAGPTPHIFHQPQKQAAMDTSIAGHSPHAIPSRSWGGLNVTYEMQQDPNKPGVSGMAGSSKDMAGPSMGSMQPTAIRNKKRAAMTSVVSMSNPPPSIPTAATQSLASVRRQPQPTPPPIYQETIKDSPPSSPSSERPLKPKMESSKMGPSCTAPHMLGNELNPESGAAACLQEQLSAELAAHAAGTAGADPLIPPPLINKAAPGANSSSGRSSGAQSLDQLLERQWEQGSQFLMEQAQHFDIASLLSCLHQLRTENVRLEDHVGNLQLRRDHLLAVNARLAIPLTTVTSGPPEPSRCQMQRENGAQVRPPPPPVRAAETITSERSHQLIMREVQQKPS